MLSVVTVCYHSKVRSGSPSAKLASIVKEDRFTLLFPLMFSHPVNLEIRCGAPGEAGRGRPVGPQLLSAAVAGGSWGTSPAQGRCLAAEEAVPARPAKRAGTPAPPPAGRTSLCLRAPGSAYRAGNSYRCSRWGCRYHRRPPGNESRPDAVIGRAAASLGIRSRRAPSHSRPRPRPRPAPPPASGLGPCPLPVT